VTMGPSTKPPAPTESDVYDRQIRLWGAEAQGKMANSKVLYVNVTGVSLEILKNLVLAGVRASICDGRSYPEALEATPNSFLDPNDASCQTTSISVAKALEPKVLELNPLLDTCDIEERPLAEVPDEYFAQFDIVIASMQTLGEAQAKRISAAAQKIYLVDCFGLQGVGVLDLGPDHEYRRELPKGKLSDLKKLPAYVSLANIIDTPLAKCTGRFFKNGPPAPWALYQSYIHYQSTSGNGKWPTSDCASDYGSTTRAWLSQQSLDEEYLGHGDLKQCAAIATAQVSPVCAVMGGVVGNEVIKAISGKGEPAHNTLLFDGLGTGGCLSFFVPGPKKD